jgi:hypothetical protein
MVIGAMPTKRKPAHQLTTDQLARRVFGKEGHKALKQLVIEHDQKKKRKSPKPPKDET